MMSAHDFDQMLAEAIHRIGKQEVYNCLIPFSERYDYKFPFPAESREEIVLAVALRVHELEGRPIEEQFDAVQEGQRRIPRSFWKKI